MEKSCLFCKHLYFSTAEGRYSEVTPGCDAEIYCMESVWRIRMYHDSTETFRKKLLLAQTCEKFDLVEMPWLDSPIDLTSSKTRQEI